MNDVVNVTADPTRRYGQPNIDFDPMDPNTIVYVVQSTAYTAAGLANGDPRCDQNVYWGQGRGEIENAPDFNVPAVFTSRDGGVAWERGTFPVPADYPALSTFGNATVAAAPDGTFYLSFLGIEWFKGLPYPLTHAGNFVSKSTDKGRTWSDPVLVHTPLDHPRIVVDPTTGRIYQSSGDRATAYPSPATEADPDVPFGDRWDRFTVASDDGITWSTPRGWGGGAEHDNYSQVYVSAANGVLAGVFQHVEAAGLGLGIDDAAGTDDDDSRCIVFQTTADDGQSWSRHEVPVRSDATSYTVPSVAADPASPGHFVVAVMNGTRSYGAKELLMGAYPTGTDVLLYATSDDGQTWTERVVATGPEIKRKLWVSFPRWRSRRPVGGRGSRAREIVDHSAHWATLRRRGTLHRADVSLPRVRRHLAGRRDHLRRHVHRDRRALTTRRRLPRHRRLLRMCRDDPGHRLCGMGRLEPRGKPREPRRRQRRVLPIGQVSLTPSIAD